MNTAVLKWTGEHGGPVVLAAGATSLLMALLSASRGSPVAAGPAPTATTTVTAPPVTVRPAPAGTTTVNAPAADTTVLAAGQRVSSAGSASRPGSGEPSGPSPHPPAAAQQPSNPCAVGLTALALHACLKLGGSR